MKSWAAKILIMLAVVIVTAHNIIAHDHDTYRIELDHDHQDDHHGKHNTSDIFGLNVIDHCFTTEHSDQIDLGFHGLHFVHLQVTSTLPSVDCIILPKTSYQLSQEFPPPPAYYTFSALRAPPISQA